MAILKFFWKILGWFVCLLGFKGLHSAIWGDEDDEKDKK